MFPWEATTEDEFMLAVEQLQAEYDRGDYIAGWHLMSVFRPGNMVYPEAWRTRVGASESKCHALSVDVFERAMQLAAGGDGRAMHVVATYYQGGNLVVAPDCKQHLDWCVRAVEAGFIHAANDLYTHYACPSKDNNPELAQHYLDLLEAHNARLVTIWHSDGTESAD